MRAAPPDSDRRRRSRVLTAGAIALIPLGVVGFEFIPPIDRGEIFVQVQYPDRNAADDDRRDGAQR